MHISGWLIYSYQYSCMGLSHMWKVCGRGLYSEHMCICSIYVNRDTCICASVCTQCAARVHTVSVSVGPMYKHDWHMFAQEFWSTKACRGSNMCALPHRGAWLSLIELCARSTHLYRHLKTCSIRAHRSSPWRPGPSGKDFLINNTA